MGRMAPGDIGLILAARYGPVSLTSPITGARPDRLPAVAAPCVDIPPGAAYDDRKIPLPFG